ncbi:hypothetical protein ACFSTI_25415 [Rhizorhabdus histidinilytica]
MTSSTPSPPPRANATRPPFPPPDAEIGGAFDARRDGKDARPRPEHVPAELVRDFDLYDIPGAAEDIQAAYRAIQQASPDIFWTPHNGGHWVATRGEDIVEMQRDYNRFSHQHIVLPPMPDAPRQIPLEMDPPEHARYRRPLMQALLPSIVSELESKVRQVAIDAVERLLPRGECEFVEDFAKVLPIHVFLELVELPLDDKAYLLALAEDSVRGRDAETRGRSQQLMGAYLLPGSARAARCRATICSASSSTSTSAASASPRPRRPPTPRSSCSAGSTRWPA